MNFDEAVKRLRQETCPNTYMPDFDKEECLKVIEEFKNNIEDSLEIWIDLLSKDGVNSKAKVRLQMQAVLFGLKNKKEVNSNNAEKNN